MTEHLGYDKHDPVGRTGGNSRNGSRSKTVLTEVGPVQIESPVIPTPLSTPRSCVSANAGSPVSMRSCCRSRRKG
jgi:hypothetical protein